MVLHIDSDASHLSLPHARSRTVGHYFLNNKCINPHLPPSTQPTPNGHIYTLRKWMRNVLASTAESEITILIHNGQEAVVLRTTLLEIKHPQLPTPIKTDRSTSSGIANKTFIPRKTRSMDMKYYWICDSVLRKELEMGTLFRFPVEGICVQISYKMIFEPQYCPCYEKL